MESVILLVEDEADLLATMQDFIAMKLPGYRTVGTTTVEGAEQELASIGAGRLSLVCVDHILEGKHGLDFLESVHRRYPSVPSILFTGRANERDELRAKSAGIHVLWKPATLSTWLQEMRDLLGA